MTKTEIKQATIGTVKVNAELITTPVELFKKGRFDYDTAYRMINQYRAEMVAVIGFSRFNLNAISASTYDELYELMRQATDDAHDALIKARNQQRK